MKLMKNVENIDEFLTTISGKKRQKIYKKFLLTQWKPESTM